jgi:hypothetical protein
VVGAAGPAAAAAAPTAPTPLSALAAAGITARATSHAAGQLDRGRRPPNGSAQPG